MKLREGTQGTRRCGGSVLKQYCLFDDLVGERLVVQVIGEDDNGHAFGHHVLQAFGKDRWERRAPRGRVGRGALCEIGPARQASTTRRGGVGPRARSGRPQRPFRGLLLIGLANDARTQLRTHRSVCAVPKTVAGVRRGRMLRCAACAIS